MTSFLQPVTGIVALTVIAIIFSEDRRANKIRLIATGVGIQFVFALLLLKVTFIKDTKKNLVKVSSGATLVSITCLSPASNPVASPQPIIAEITPSRRNGN